MHYVSAFVPRQLAFHIYEDVSTEVKGRGRRERKGGWGGEEVASREKERERV